MTKKNKTGVIIGVIVLVIAGFIGKYQYTKYQYTKYQYTKYQLAENLKLAEMSNIFMTIYPEDDDLWKGAHGSYTNEELKAFQKNPPKIRMNTSSGLGLKALAYNYCHKDTPIDAEYIQSLMESGEFHDTYEYTIGFVDWVNKNGESIVNYQDALQYASQKLGKGNLNAETTTYQDYLAIINNPDGQKYIEEYYAS